MVYDNLNMDLYELTMAAGYYVNKVDSLAVFELFCYRLPESRSYLINCGLQQAIEYILKLKFSDDDVDFLKNLEVFKSVPEEFFDYLKSFKFTGNVFAMPEGEIFFEREPVLQIEAPIIEAQILETFVLSLIHFQSLIATKASRIVSAANSGKKERTVIDFGTRRAHGPQAGLLAARASYIGGCAGTSNLLAAKEFGIPIFGTMAHSWVEAFDSEQDSFKKYLNVFPNHALLLIDTYDTIKSAAMLKKLDTKIRGVRIDSGDLAELSKKVRLILNNEGMDDVKIVTSGNLNEEKIANLIENGAPVDIFGVGTEMVTSHDDPSLDMVYKLVQVQDKKGAIKLKAKKSSGKNYFPSRKQVFRQINENRFFEKDIIREASKHKPPKTEILLKPIVQKGVLIESLPDIQSIRGYAKQRLNCLSSMYKKNRRINFYKVEVKLGNNEKTNKALLIVDVQKDFCPGGTLPISEGDKIIHNINRYIDYFRDKGFYIFASRDWHPRQTGHFQKFGGMWPNHCVQETEGAQFHSELNLPDATIILSKGMDPQKDCYSAFDAVDKDGKNFSFLLYSYNINELYVCGLATDYCVKYSVLEALKNQFVTYLLTDAIKGVEETTSKAAINEMEKAGVIKTNYEQIKA